MARRGFEGECGEDRVAEIEVSWVGAVGSDAAGISGVVHDDVRTYLCEHQLDLVGVHKIVVAGTNCNDIFGTVLLLQHRPRMPAEEAAGAREQNTRGQVRCQLLARMTSDS